MASTQQDESLSEDLACPICLDFFTDPVTLQCGHNFCRSCVTRTWETTEKICCPECGEEFAERNLRASRALANLSEKARKLNLKTREKGDKFLCDEHQEELKLFCQTDTKLICYSCRDAREHREHHFMPVNEAVEIFKALVKSSLDSATEKKSLILEMEHQQKQKISEIRDQSQVLEKHIMSEFSEMHQFLTGKEKALIADLQQEKGEILGKMQNNLLEIQECLKSLQRKLFKLQEQMEQKDIMLFLKEDSWRNTSGNDEHQELSVKDGFLNVEKFKGPFLETVWKEILDAFNPASVTLDVETANPRLEVSDDRKSVRLSGTWSSLPDTGKRFTDWAGVLGSEGFTMGRHYWEVAVAGNYVWSVGIAAESVERKGWVGLIPENGFWTIGRVGARFYVNTSPGSPLPAESIPEKLGIRLSYGLGTVSFYNADTKSHLHTFTGNKFTEKLYPFFWTGDENKWLRICSGSALGL
ncbi:zinc-binding protein A33-like [Mobula hypostoma]|uniref:zinc-binding protein A33-like n=1 Tax=Mobula hypostoma TaxID=723540 RepID=UPI002FC34AE6